MCTLLSTDVGQGGRMNGDQFKAARQAAGWSIRGAAAQLGTTPATIQRWEAGASRIPSDVADRVRTAVDTGGGDGDLLTRREQQDVIALLRRRVRVAKAEAKRRSADLLAQFEAAIATIEQADAAAWTAITAAADAA